MARVLVALFMLAACAATTPVASAISWRLFAGREECIGEYLPAGQWAYLQAHTATPDHSKVLIDLGFVVTSKYGTEETKAAVDFALYDTSDKVLRHEEGVSEAEASVAAVGGHGPYRACFRISNGALLQPSVIVKLTYFVIYTEEFYAESFEWEQKTKEAAAAVAAAADVHALGSKDQIDSMTHGLHRLDHYLHNVTNEQRYLYARTERHLRTAKSTLTRTFWYYSAIYGTICLASFSQLVGVRVMFRKSRRHGLIV